MSSTIFWPVTDDLITQEYFNKVATKDAEHKLWRDIVEASKTNPGLTELLDRAKIYYYLGKE